MDDATLGAYDRDAKAFADAWDTQPPSSDLQAVVRQFFIPGPTADVGCGSDEAPPDVIPSCEGRGEQYFAGIEKTSADGKVTVAITSAARGVGSMSST